MKKKLFFENYYLRLLSKKDINQNYLNWFTNYNNKFIVNKNYENIQQLKNYYNENKTKKNIILGIFLVKTDLHIGNIKFEKIDLKKRTAILGIMIGNINYIDKGIGNKSISIACNWLFEKLKIYKVYLKVNTLNLIAINSYLKSGFYIKTKNKNSLTMVRNYFLNKLVLGTANYEKKYGIFKKSLINKREKNRIIKLVNKFNLSKFDVSESYGLNSFKKEKKSYHNLKLYLKLSKSIKFSNFQNINNLINIFNKNICAIFFHGYDLLEKFLQSKSYNKVYNLILKKYPIGISIYEPSELIKANKYLNYDFAQIPINIFDHRFLSKKILKFIKKKKLKILQN